MIKKIFGILTDPERDFSELDLPWWVYVIVLPTVLILILGLVGVK